MSRLIRVWKTQGLSDLCFAIVDDEDYARVSKYQWHLVRTKSGNTYATMMDEYMRPTVSMHRFILKLEPREGLVDHIDNNGLNNRKDNLRGSNYSLNQANRIKQINKRRPTATSQYKGVSKSKGRKNFQATICINQKDICIGTFASELDAAKAYDAKARELFGEHAKTNF